MTYITGTITDANPGPALHTLVEAALTANGWTLEDTVTITTTTAKVWKNPAANNPTGKDFFVVLRYPTSGAGNMQTYVCELWNAAGDTGVGFCTGYTGPLAVGAAPNYRVMGDTARNLDHGEITGTPVVALPSSAFGYWISVTSTRVIMLFSMTPTQVQVLGLYEPDAGHVTTAGANALYAGRFLYPNPNYNTGITRLPNYVGNFTSGNYLLVPSASGWATTWGQPGIPSGTTTVNPRRGVKVPISAMANSNDLGAGFLGYIPDLIVLLAAATVARGDTVTIAGQTWVLTSSQGSTPAYSVAFKAA